MEKLEAALARARELRRASLGDPGSARLGGARAVSASADWMDLPEIELSGQHIKRHRLNAVTGGRDAVAYDMLRSRTLRQMKEKGWTRLAITSPTVGCGKTTVAANLALSLARQKDLRIILIDLDLRRPSLQNVMGVKPRRSIHEVLEGTADFADASFRIADNLIMGFNASASRHPAELLSGERARAALEALERKWTPDLVIFDMCPMMVSDDNVGFLPNVDCALMIVGAEKTKIANIDICEKELSNLTNVLGVVLNKCRYPDDAAGYATEFYK